MNVKQIRNPKISGYENTPIALHNFECYCLGRVCCQRKVIKFRILACKAQPLRGPHLVVINGKEIKLNSLNAFKKMFNYDDKLSFQRSVFILDLENNRSFRLSTIQHLIVLPLMEDRTQLTVFRPRIILPAFNEYLDEKTTASKFIEYYNTVSNIYSFLYYAAEKEREKMEGEPENSMSIDQVISEILE